jgi:hypothetical protein
VRTINISEFRKTEAINDIEKLHEECILVPADETCNNILFVCKAHHYNGILHELGINSILATLLTL